METGTIILIVVGVIVLLLILYVIGTYNGLVKFRNMVIDQWAQIDVQLKRRADLIPNLVETVKGYASHEQDTLDDVVKARNNFKDAATPEAEMKASGELTQALGRLFAVAEAYPDLKANQNFLQLQGDLSGIEEKIAYARQFYNDSVLTYKNKLETFPSNIVAGMFNFEQKAFFETDEQDKVAPTVSFKK
ncbi:MAG: LemA family protein [Bacilli bacterium]|nr:LemA family protein [Bacilli bacterium]MDD3304723.1 LemA family protein [Bacilli bacterium]MDD4053598.1 LemA family protein [Bacilli bacterium]MDD4411097.1 LemA family protein [Bacilli bacterium]